MKRTVIRVTAWNQNMHDKRTATGLTLQKAVFKAWELLPEPYQKNPKMLERYETTWDEDKADAVFLLALSRVYRCSLEDLSPIAAERMAVVDILSASPGASDSRCYPSYAGELLSPAAA